METIKLKPCPFCQNTDIGVKDNIIDLYPDKINKTKTRRKIWAYCRRCEAESEKITSIVDDSTDEEIKIAVKLWNKDIEVQ